MTRVVLLGDRLVAHCVAARFVDLEPLIEAQDLHELVEEARILMLSECRHAAPHDKMLVR